MDYLILVEIVQCRNNLLNQKCDLLLIPRLRPRHALEHIHQNVHLTRDVGVMRVVDDAADAKHIGVKDLFKDLCLLLNALSFLLSKVLRVVRCYSLFWISFVIYLLHRLGVRGKSVTIMRQHITHCVKLKYIASRRVLDANLIVLFIGVQEPRLLSL